jgi:tellurite resistance protein TerC
MILVWVGFFVLILLLLAIDLGVVNKRSHTVTMREAIRASIVWIAIGVAFTGVVYLVYDQHVAGFGVNHDVDGLRAASEYITAYLVEKSLSVDNIFVIAMLFTFFKVPAAFQHRVLYWGILGAIVFRGIMIAAGAALVASFGWVFYIFGAILLYTAFKMLVGGDEEFNPEESRIVRFARKVLPIVERYEGDRFVVHINGKRHYTLLFLALLVIEATDVVFAVDSIPAIFGFTSEPFIVMTSNIFAILGLRSLYFVVAGAMAEFRYLKIAVSVILLLVGIKMFLHSFVKIDATISLLVVVSILSAGVIMSIRANRLDQKRANAQSGGPTHPN